MNLCSLLVQVYAPGPYGDYTALPHNATQVVYSAEGAPYSLAYPYQYQGEFLHGMRATAPDERGWQ